MMDGKKVKLRIKKFRYVFPAKFSMLYSIPHIVREFTNRLKSKINLCNLKLGVFTMPGIL